MLLPTALACHQRCRLLVFASRRATTSLASLRLSQPALLTSRPPWAAAASPPQPRAASPLAPPLLLLRHQQARWSGHDHGPRKMVIQPSRHNWDHFWDDVHYYFLLAAVPCGLLSLYLYIFVGPAQLTELPEDYEPEEYEYHRHPLTRFIAWVKSRWLVSEQEIYEKKAAYNNEEYLRMITKQQFKQIKDQDALLGDYWGYYFVPVNPRPVSHHHAHRQIEELSGDMPYGFQSEDPRELPRELGAPRTQF